MSNLVAIVTGASRGIGRDIVKRLAKNNYNIVLASKNPQSFSNDQTLFCSLIVSLWCSSSKLEKSPGIKDINKVISLLKEVKNKKSVC